MTWGTPHRNLSEEEAEELNDVQDLEGQQKHQKHWTLKMDGESEGEERALFGPLKQTNLSIYIV